MTQDEPRTVTTSVVLMLPLLNIPWLRFWDRRKTELPSYLRDTIVDAIPICVTIPPRTQSLNETKLVAFSIVS